MRFLEKVDRCSNILFGNDILQNWREIYPADLVKFCTEEAWLSNQAVDLSKVRGTDHPDYAGLTWHDVLRDGKRMHINIPLVESKPAYYHERSPKLPTMKYATCDDENYYVYTDGNHRTVIGRFHFHIEGMPARLYGVNVHRFSIDRELYHAYTELVKEIEARRLPILINVKQECTGREDGEGWKKDIYRVTLIIRNSKTSQTEVLDKSRIGNIIAFMKTAPWLKRKVFLPNEFSVLRGAL